MLAKGQHARFRPAGIGDNPVHSDLNIFNFGGSHGFRLLNDSFGTAWKLVNSTRIIGSSQFNEVDTYVRFTTQIPAVITTTTNFVNITGEIYGSISSRIAS
jgi:hypothetical protein